MSPTLIEVIIFIFSLAVGANVCILLAFLNYCLYLVVKKRINKDVQQQVEQE